METSKGQGKLFSITPMSNDKYLGKELDLKTDLLKNWQRRLNRYQSELFHSRQQISSQTSLFENNEMNQVQYINPLDLTPLPINFWRSPTSPYQGPAIYMVIDRPEGLDTPILLYIGETIAAERRWKGEHDCKAYLSAYSQALSQAGLTSHLSIRFCTDVPKETKSRRELEQNLIKIWLPPFNKETRSRWATPFTSQLD